MRAKGKSGGENRQIRCERSPSRSIPRRRRIRSGKDSFWKIWLHIAIPLVTITIVVLLLVLGMTLAFLQNMAITRARENGWEMEYILEGRAPETKKEMAEMLKVANADMVYVLYDEDGKKFLCSDEADYQDNMLITHEVYDNLLRGIDRYRKAENANDTVHADMYGYVYYYGQKQIHISGKNYFFAYMGVSAPWLKWKDEFLCIGIMVLVGVLLLTLLIAGDYYRIYCVRLKVEKYYRDTSCALVHDLKTPLTAISGYAENLKENVHTEKRDYYVNAICKNVDNMSRTIENVLELARVEHFERELSREELKLEEVAKEIVEQYERQAREQQLTVSIQGALCIQADRELMKRAMENLIGNAVKYTSPKEQIIIEMGEGKCSVTNTGIAIPQGQIEELWKPFVKGNEARTAATGTGIGLAIVREILMLHGFDGKMESRDNSVCVTICF